MNKNIFIPLSIIIVAVLIGGAVLFSSDNKPTDKQLSAAADDNLRKLELSVPGMFCAGCTASVEGYVSSEPGVKRVQARLAPTKSATIIYDPTIITKEKIIKNRVFDLYGVSIISDNSFIKSSLPKKIKEKLNIPQEIQDKSRQAALLLKQKSEEGKNVSAAQNLLNQVNNNIEQRNFNNAKILLDAALDLLHNL